MATRDAVDGAADHPSVRDLWRRVRRYAVSRRTIERATERRLSGDWAGACAAADVDVGIDLTRVTRRYGARCADRVEDDLRHLAPDLLRWHLPRGADGRLVPGRRYTLDRCGAAFLVAETVSAQRIRLVLAGAAGPARDSYRGHRYRWDARRADELRTRIGGTARRAPFFDPTGTPVPRPGAAHDTAGRYERVALAGSTVDAWLLAGIPLRLRRSRATRGAAVALARLPVAPARLLAETRGLLAAGSAGPGLHDAPAGGAGLPDPGGTAGEVDGWVRFRIGNGCAVVLSSAGPAYVVAAGAAPPVPVLPDVAWQACVDLDLVRHDEIGPDELHPLVRDALFPARPGVASGPPEPRRPGPVRVRCTGGESHALAVREGRLVAPAHPAAEQRRERVLARFGGPLAPCLATLDAWASGAGRVPYELARQRYDALERVRHGDTDTLLWLLRNGLPATVRLADGGTLLHALPELDHGALLPALVAAGLSPDDTDHAGRDPAQRADLAGDPALAALLRTPTGDVPARTDPLAPPDGANFLDLHPQWRHRTHRGRRRP
ncbi:hypothetical protein [Actinocatenispora rupis]|uniref:Ankyrin repeat-containing protein n=1 Tax=Actinocatenispora rupis TaxID=519421 RepID=A0A8J3JCJ6_9ACTN|nr:hypothetical protein [Actinocatenispora rupis]GID13498.1 hypothetical protein Aru02nite_43870 [Actinocatenispora rupis]